MKHALAGALALACALTASPVKAVAAPAPQARVAYGDLRMDTARGQRLLVQRVLAAARGYCRLHADVVTPAHRRNNPRYCVDSIRVQLVDAMPDTVRTAWTRGWARVERQS